MKAKGNVWSDDELTAAISSYLQMLNLEKAGESYSKASFNKELREGALRNRTKSSIEYRMQNISAALQLAGHNSIEGYKPAKNIGSNVVDKIYKILSKLDFELLKPSPDPEVVERRASAAVKLGSVREPPAGYSAPPRELINSFVYFRCPKVKAWALQRANGVCEGCGEKAPFIKLNGLPYLEVHHLKPLRDGGEDTVENVAALCPNCHRRCHYSEDAEGFTRKVQGRIGRQ